MFCSQVGTFTNLVRLRWLDLSENKLRVISSGAFQGLDLQHLFLNGNRNIQLVPGSFDGLATSGLYLHDCALTDLPPHILFPLVAPPSDSTKTANGDVTSSNSVEAADVAGLVNLWLNGNRLTRLDRRLADVFRHLSHLRLGGNPLHCNCEAKWLREELYDSGGDGVQLRGADPPTCDTPSRLRGVAIGDLKSIDELMCRAPSFGNIDVQFDDDDDETRASMGDLERRGLSGRLRCRASGDPMPTVYWIQPSGKAARYDPRHRPVAAASTSGDVVDVNEGVLVVKSSTSDTARTSSTISGMYICIANNEAGNVTLTVNVSWPSIIPETVASIANRPVLDLQSNVVMYREPIAMNPAALPKPWMSVAMDENDRLRSNDQHNSIVYRVLTVSTKPEVEVATPKTLEPASRSFTGLELASAVIGTHLTTLAGVALSLIVCYKRRESSRGRAGLASDVIKSSGDGSGDRYLGGGRPVVLVNEPNAQRYLVPGISFNNGGKPSNAATLSLLRSR